MGALQIHGGGCAGVADSRIWLTTRAGFRVRRKSSASGATDQAGKWEGDGSSRSTPLPGARGGGLALRGVLESRRRLTVKYPIPPEFHSYGRGDCVERLGAPVPAQRRASGNAARLEGQAEIRRRQLGAEKRPLRRA